jgi:hypothetical protein
MTLTRLTSRASRIRSAWSRGSRKKESNASRAVTIGNQAGIRKWSSRPHVLAYVSALKPMPACLKCDGQSLR